MHPHIKVTDVKNIVLIGMPGAGKSTVGVLLAKSMLMSFCDTDLLIQNETGESLSDTIKKQGIDAFIRLEDEIIFKNDFKNSVIATGGSAVYGERAMNKLKENGKIVYLHVDFNEIEKRVTNITTRGIVLKNGKSLADAFDERKPLYDKYADVVIDCTGSTIENSVKMLAEKLSK